jgi:hypothetical protein
VRRRKDGRNEEKQQLATGTSLKKEIGGIETKQKEQAGMG